MADDTKPVPCSVCGHKVVELDGALYHFVGGDFANERCSNSFQHVRPDLAPCSSCGEGGYLITLPDFASNNMYVEGRVKCSICRMVCNVKDWNRLHGGTRIEVEGCGGCPLTTLVSWTCSHPKTSMRNKCKQVLLYYFKSFPTWCPLRTKNQGPITIGIKEVE